MTERRLKIVLVTVGLGVGGTERQLVDLASRLDRRRFDVLVCAMKADEGLVPELEACGVRVERLRGRAWWDVRTLWRLYRLLQREQPDILHAFLLWANMAGRLAGRLAGVPAIITSYREVLVWPRWPYRWLERLTSRWAHASTCSSDAIRREVLHRLGHAPASTLTIHNGVEVERFECARPADRHAIGLQDGIPVIGTVGRLSEPEKGLTVLHHAAAALKRRSMAFQVLIVGGGPSEIPLRRLRDELGLTATVLFAGQRHDIPELLQLVDVFAMPSLSEGFGVSILEAMAAGKAVVASNVGGVPEIVRHERTGLLVPAGDPTELGDALAALLKDPERARRMGVNGRQRVRELFDVRTMVERHAALYERMGSRLTPSEDARARGADAAVRTPRTPPARQAACTRAASHAD